MDFLCTTSISRALCDNVRDAQCNETVYTMNFVHERMCILSELYRLCTISFHAVSCKCAHWYKTYTHPWCFRKANRMLEDSNVINNLIVRRELLGYLIFLGSHIFLSWVYSRVECPYFIRLFLPKSVKTHQPTPSSEAINSPLVASLTEQLHNDRVGWSLPVAASDGSRISPVRQSHNSLSIISRTQTRMYSEIFPGFEKV